MSKELKIFSNRCWVDGNLQPATISIKEGSINSISKGKIIDAIDYGNLIIMPGVIDAHVHINEPGRTEWEGFETATKAAAEGGTTSIVDMPLNSSPVTISKNAFIKKLEASKGKLNVNCGFYGGLIPGSLNDLIPLMEAGILGVKCFLTHSGIDDFPNVSEKDLDEAMPIIKKYNLPLLVHCEISSGNKLEDNCHDYKTYLESRPDNWETSAIELMIKLCRKHGCRVHIVHVSSALSLKLIKDAKAEGLPLTAETCPHYLYFNSETIPDGQTVYKCAPPIRNKKNNELLKKALAEGILDFITSDHSPASPDVKELESGNLSAAWGGIAGLQFLLSSSFYSLKENLSLEKFIPLITEKPAIFLGLNKKGFLKEGYDADIVIWDPEGETFVTEKNIFHKHTCCPYANNILAGKVFSTIVNGELIFENDIFIKRNTGKWLMKK